MSRISRHSPELRERAVRMVSDNRADYPSEWARLKELERENRDLRRANAILKDASIFFATEPGGQTRK